MYCRSFLQASVWENGFMRIQFSFFIFFFNVVSLSFDAHFPKNAFCCVFSIIQLIGQKMMSGKSILSPSELTQNTFCKNNLHHTS